MWPAQLTLPATPKDFDKANPVIKRVIAAVPLCYERCGRSYHSRQAPAKKSGKKSKKKGKKSNKKGGNKTGAEQNDEDLRKRLEKECDLEDFYGLLGLGEFRFIATDDQIRNNYKKGSLICHPDKSLPSERPKAELRYKAMQKAHEHLLDKNKRMAYDSSLPFNDSLPADKEGTTDKTFYKVYGKAFQNNARFSSVKPIPSLGGPETPYDEVNRFYDFWFDFKSWREFAHLNEHRPDDGTPREEKRWMQRENQKLQAKMKKEERARVGKLVAAAMEKDPRVRAKRAEEEAAKKKLKQDKIDRKLRLIQEEEDKKAAIERKKQEEVDAKKVAKEAKMKQKQELKKYRQTFRKMARDPAKCGVASEDMEVVERFLSAGTYLTLGEPVQELTDAVEEGRGEAKLLAMMRKFEGKEEEHDRELAEKKAVQKMEERKQQEVATRNKNREWTHDEEVAMQKALIKFPAGSQERWERIAEAVNVVNKEEEFRTSQQVIRKAKEGQTRKTTDTSKAFETYKNATKDKREQQQKRTETAELEAATKARLAKEKLDITKATAEAKAAAEAAAAAAAPAPAKKEEAEDDWDAELQAALEKAMATTSKKLTSDERWEKIAEQVPGKNKKECIKRFKKIRKEILAAKNAKNR